MPTSTTLRYADLAARAPQAVEALLSLGRAIDASGLSKQLSELLKIRVSQINACAFCLHFHLKYARKLGVSAQKIDMLPVWREMHTLYSPAEQAALAWAEALCYLPGTPLDHAVREALDKHFSADEVINLTLSIGHINAWNRIAGGLSLDPELAGGTGS